jgi:hypothetical protein
MAHKVGAFPPQRVVQVVLPGFMNFRFEWFPESTLIERIPTPKTQPESPKQILLIGPPTFSHKMVDSFSLKESVQNED